MRIEENQRSLRSDTDFVARMSTAVARKPGTLASLAMNREKKTRAILAEMGIPPESAAISLRAAKDALLKLMPDSKAKAQTAAELFEAAIVPSRETGRIALRELLAKGKIERIGKGINRDAFRYFLWKRMNAEALPSEKQTKAQGCR